jgi:putative ABC transport system permease protein
MTLSGLQRLVFSGVGANDVSVLRVAPILGRSFRAEDELPGNDDVVILTTGLWRALFAGGPAAGQTLTLDGKILRSSAPDVVVPGELADPGMALRAE